MRFEKLRRSKLTNYILQKLGGPDKGLGRILFKSLYNYLHDHPDASIQESRDYFSLNAERINNICSVLSDDSSKDIFRRLIQFRSSMDHSIHPGYVSPQYFIDDIISISNDEVFVDVGGYDGSSSVDYIRFSNGNYRSIVIFEPDTKCLEMIRNNPVLKENASKITIIPNGAWDKKTSLKFIMNSDGTSKITDSFSEQNNDNSGLIPVVRIDDIAECKDASFIKMDVEGAEWEALHGAERTILQNKPKLAISIYHSDEDMLRLIEYVHCLVPEYKIYIRHHSSGTIDTVAYFII